MKRFIVLLFTAFVCMPTAVFAAPTSKLISKNVDEEGKEEIVQPQVVMEEEKKSAPEPVSDAVPFGTIVDGLSRYSVTCNPARANILVFVHEVRGDVPYIVDGYFENEKLIVTYTMQHDLQFGKKPITLTSTIDSFTTDRPKKVVKAYEAGYKELQIECKYPDIKKATNKVMPVAFLPKFLRLLVDEMMKDLWADEVAKEQ